MQIALFSEAQVLKIFGLLGLTEATPCPAPAGRKICIVKHPTPDNCLNRVDVGYYISEGGRCTVFLRRAKGSNVSDEFLDAAEMQLIDNISNEIAEPPAILTDYFFAV